MTNKIEIILKAVDQASGPLEKFGAAFEKLTGFSLTAAGGVAMLGTAINKVGEFAKQSIEETQAYNIQVRNLAQNLGIGTEETSRMIQAADDFGVTIGSVESALKMALRNGFAPSIDTLADMADKYNELKDPTERAAALTKVFGRNWSQLTPLLRQGGDAIRANAAAQSDALIVSEKEAQASEELRIATDNLNDSKEALSQTLGNKLIPVQAKWMTGINDMITGERNLFEAGLDFWGITKKQVDVTEDQIVVTDDLTESMDAVGKSTSFYLTDMNQMPQAIQDYITKTDEAAAANNDMALSIMDISAKSAGALALDALGKLWEQDKTKAEEYRMQMWLVMTGPMGMTAAEAAAQVAMWEFKNSIDETGVSMGDLYGMTQNVVKEIDLIEAWSKKQWNVMVNFIGTYTGPGGFNIPGGNEVTSPGYTPPSTGGGGSTGGGTGGGINWYPGWPGGANGMNMIIPAGYPNDSAYVRASSGEQVIIKPATTNNYNLTIHSNARAENMRADFAQMQAMG